jgi:hypothetical protein
MKNGLNPHDFGCGISHSFVFCLGTEWEIVFYFLAHQEMRLGPKNTAKPPVDFLSSVHPAQSAFEKALAIVEADCRICRPVLRVCYRK